MECASEKTLTQHASRQVGQDPEISKIKGTFFLSERGLMYVINKCRKLTRNLINLTRCVGIELHKNKWHFESKHAGLLR